MRYFIACGMVGMGKSKITMKYAYTCKEHFEAVFWLGADDPRIFAAKFENLVASRDIVIE
jgi:hypothetical protein